MLTAAITAAIAWILSLFGIKPGPYLVVVAAVVKGIIILVGVLLGAKVVRKRVKAGEAKATNTEGPTPPTPPEQPEQKQT